MNEGSILDLKSSIAPKEMARKITRQLYFIIKRMFDIICAMIGLIVLSPLFIIIGALIRLDDGKAPIYKQKRVGKNGKIIGLYKFRTMVPDADKILKELLKQPKYKREWKENQKFANDPRITKVGNILRKTSLDELPQLINVIKGDMSLIGPRPLVIGELDEHDGNHEVYESVRPGITGWWACNGRSNTTYKERLELEYYYAKNCSLLLDIKCFFKTIMVVLLKKGAK